MAVPPSELQPRSAIELFDASLRLCSRSLGVWAVLLPAHAALALSLVWVWRDVEAHQGHLASGVALTGALWLRGIAKGALAAFLEGELFGTSPASVRTCWRQALARLPSLTLTTTASLVREALIWGLTLGVGALFASQHMVAPAVAMSGQGPAHRPIETCQRLLGSRASVAGVLRLFGLLQWVIAINLHVLAAGAVMVMGSLFAVDVSFWSRFVAVDNPVWVASVALLTFLIFDPVRGACGVLLLVDARVRREGLDLMRAVERLHGRGLVRAATLVAVLCGGTALGADELQRRSTSHAILDAADDCEVNVSDEERLLLAEWAAEPAMAHVEKRLNAVADAENECERVAAILDSVLAGLPAPGSTPPPSPDSLRQVASQILSRPEFAADPVDDPVDATPAAPLGIWDTISQWFKDLLHWLEDQLDGSENARQRAPASPWGGAEFATLVAILASGGLLALLLKLFRARPTAANPTAVEHRAFELAGASPSALSRRPAEWLEAAEHLASQGKFRDAVRALYLAVLGELHRAGTIEYDQKRSNWDYVKQFRGPPEPRSAFRLMTLQFDRIWYGRTEPTAETWREVKAESALTLASLLPQDGHDA